MDRIEETGKSMATTCGCGSDCLTCKCGKEFPAEDLVFLGGNDLKEIVEIVQASRRAIEGGSFDPALFFAASGEAIRKLASAIQEQTSLEDYRRRVTDGEGAVTLSEGELEVDEKARVSAGDGGAYVQAWIWVNDPEESTRSAHQKQG